ncbi:heme-binding protein [Oharaeibacter diazotrophicus]|uniref:Uncharacterized protein GlcG (DUF336 family) n=1 Tax=Oharaeibacter diazotrophicus TaxID=1920512 RepID=A0A4R6RL77_9HYPH|nr:heme-binding protein [Oharaeibacter diazotrophicus]TDP87270.1 uncharacterized protein GlcG (DUF336 family) [Oharaeibacter diazotrophicus]BBE70786.1 hypothetical protein OHA_1_00353 [Pleomorphomonas sp. SM30]GLS77535.1 hypothetical protein GCM10007904_28720 [Oharaeibacter diazotrophicus]
MSRSHPVRRAGRTAAVCLLAGLAAVPSATAQVRSVGYELPLALATRAVDAAIAACAAAGYPVAAAVVDTAGELKAYGKGDHATVHTRTTSFRKAYTVATLGPVFGFDGLGAFVTKTAGTPAAAALATVPDVILLAGGVAVRVDGEVVAGIGVGGAPGGDKDEVCAAAGLAAIRDALPKH